MANPSLFFPTSLVSHQLLQNPHSFSFVISPDSVHLLTYKFSTHLLFPSLSHLLQFFLYLCYYLVIFFPTCYYPGRLRFSSIRARCGHRRTHILISRSLNRVSSSCLSLLRPFLCTLMIQRVQECHMLPTSLPHPLHTNSEVSVGF